jgi:thiamine-phosphate pyrophosphorylase
MKFELILITSPELLANETKWVTRLFEEGLKKLHIRKPRYTKSELASYISQIPTKYHSRLILHSHYSLATQYAVGGLHLTERSRKKAFPASYIKNKHSLSASFHSTDDIVSSRRKYTYILLSPVFDSISKRGHKSAFDYDKLQVFLEQHKNIIALGGIDNKTLVLAKKMGFCGAATLGYIWQSPDPTKAFKRLQSKIK